MAANSIPVLRVPRTDLENGFILLQAQPLGPKSTSQSDLDVKLLATEGENAYGARLKHTRMQKFIQKSFTGTHEEFVTIVTSLLFPHFADDKDRPLLEGVAFSATIEDSTVTLAIRKSVGGIKQRIGLIDIPQTEDEIALFEWAEQTCALRDTTKQKLIAAESKLEKQQNDIEKLIDQLNELAKRKEEHEATLLLKFQALLHTKKQRIRELTQLLTENSEVKPSSPQIQPEEVKSTQIPKRKGKGKAATRKATTRKKTPAKLPVKKLSESEESEGSYQRMDVDHDNKEKEVELLGDDEQGQESDARTTEDELEVETSSDGNAAKNKKLSKASFLDKVRPKTKARGVADGSKNPASTRSSRASSARTLKAQSQKPAAATTTTVTTRQKGEERAIVAKTPEPRSSSAAPSGNSQQKNNVDDGFADDTEEEEDEL